MMVANKAVAHPWFCDVIGHMTTRFYVAMFDDASYHFLYEMLHWSGAKDDKGEVGWADVRHVIEYQAEVSAGDVLEVRAGLRKIGRKSMTAFYEMVNLGRDEIAATLECVYVLFDLETRKAVVLTDEIRSAVEKFLPGGPGT